MLHKARRYLSSADLLRRNGDLDSAISRLYYAMFYGAEALLWAAGKSFSSHRAVIAAFGEHFIKSGLLPKEMHQWLHLAFEKRQISDYEYLTDISEEEVLDLQRKAAQFLDKTENLLRTEGL
ncbi:MAG: HEPN domain-containing protein [Deltaproteobacteria bacterium]|nr:HEPN domain-containing protein [Deltaproteobacteria bacterium]